MKLINMAKTELDEMNTPINTEGKDINVINKHHQ